MVSHWAVQLLFGGLGGVVPLSIAAFRAEKSTSRLTTANNALVCGHLLASHLSVSAEFLVQAVIG